MNICVIGGTGHIGRFLIPFLVREGYAVTVITSGRTQPQQTGEWSKVTFRQGKYVRDDANWYSLIAELNPEVVIDILGADLPGVYQAAKKTCRHLVACGSTWMFGPPRVVPTPPIAQNPCQFDGYTSRYREILSVKDQARNEGIAFTAVMPPNICGPGKIPMDCIGDRDIKQHQAMKEGKPVTLPENCNTLIGPCDASDIAKIFSLAVRQRSAAADEIFNAGSAYALTAPQFIEAFGRIYKTTIPITYVPQEKYYTQVLPDLGCNYHFRHHMCPDISKTTSKLGYRPEFTPEETLDRAVAWMKSEKLL